MNAFTNMIRSDVEHPADVIALAHAYMVCASVKELRVTMNLIECLWPSTVRTLFAERCSGRKFSTVQDEAKEWLESRNLLVDGSP